MGVRVESIADKGYLEPHEVSLPPNIEDGSFERDFRKRLRDTGFSPLEVDVLSLKYIDSYTLSEISQELGIPDSRVTMNILRKAKERMKKKFRGTGS